MKTVQETAYAKINLGLDIYGVREDNYHEVSMIMQSVGLCDTITITEGNGNGITVSSNLPGLSNGPDNLAYMATELLAEHCRIKPNVHIDLDKKIFMAAGLAGGSSDGAAVMRGLNKFWELGLENSVLEKLSGKLGSDVPFCIEGGTTLATGRGDMLTKLPDMPLTYVVLVKPRGLEVSTAWAYANFNPRRVVNAPTIWQLEEKITQGMPAILPYMGNVLETVTIPAHPVIASIKAAMLSAGAAYALMSGSGPAVYALAYTKEQADKIAKAMGAFDVELAVTTTIGRKN